MRKQYVAGNWKMNGNSASIGQLLSAICKDSQSFSAAARVIVFPPAAYLAQVQSILTATGIEYGAQNVYPADAGAYTGEHSGPMLKDLQCTYVLVGHSERRKIFAEDEKIVAKKYHHVKEHDMIPVLCVGETLEEREKSLTEQVIERQLLAVANGADCFENAIIAYEPVWAIGTGETATPEQAQEAHAYIRQVIKGVNASSAEAISILYGGSVNEKNAGDLFAMPDVDGGLVGGASLDAHKFVEVIQCIS